MYESFSVDLFINGSPERPPSISLISSFTSIDLSIVVLVAIIPENEEFSTCVIILLIVSSDSSGEIFKKTGLLISKSLMLLSMALIKIDKFSLSCKSLKFGVFGEDILIVM